MKDIINISIRNEIRFIMLSPFKFAENILNKTLIMLEHKVHSHPIQENNIKTTKYSNVG